MKAATGTATETVSYRRATLLDVPSMFELMMEGSEIGAFTEQFMVRAGGARLLFYLLGGVTLRLRWWNPASRETSWTMLCLGDETIGFMTTKCTRRSDGCVSALLELMVIDRAHRGRGHGKAAIADLLEQLP